MLKDLIDAYQQQNEKARQDYDSAKNYRGKEPELSESGSVLNNRYTLWETYNLDKGE